MGSIEGLIAVERRILSRIVAELSAMEARRDYERWGCASLFELLTRRLGLSEGEAWRRVRTARLARRFPAILELLGSGETHLTAVVLLSAAMTEENHLALLREAKGRSRRRIEFMAARLAPRSGGPDAVERVCPGCRPTAAPEASPRQSVVPLSAEKVRISFDGEEALLKSLERARELLRHKHPAGRIKDVFAEALKAFLDAKDRDRRKPPQRAVRPGPRRRYIPEKVKAAVWRRDGGRCAFRLTGGGVCGETGGLEFDHVIPWALGGRSDVPGNVRLLCRAHNSYAARHNSAYAEELHQFSPL